MSDTTPEEVSNVPTEEEFALLYQAAQEARKIREAERGHARQDVSPDEYVKRLANARRQDLEALRDIKGKRSGRASREWAEKVGSTFAPAETKLPAVHERVERLRQGRGLHKTSLVLFGDKLGRGKTWTAYGYLNALVSEGIILPGQIFFGTESSVISKIANAGFQRNEEMIGMKRAAHKVFFIDDVGQGYFFREDQRHEVWYELIDHAYTKRLTLILTTNKLLGDTGPNGLQRWIGERAFDRLKTLVGADGAIMLAGENKRDRVLAENEEAYRGRTQRRNV